MSGVVPHPSTRIPALDGFRGIAILWVLVHNSMYFHFPMAHGVTQIAGVISGTGWIGVQMFFVLSGFLITGNLLDSQQASNYYSAFYGRRVLRIFPLYYLTLLGVLVLAPHLSSASPAGTFGTQIWLWVFLFNWVHPLGFPNFGLAHFWSLAVEEQFYLVWPFAIRRMTLPTVVKTGVIIAGLALLARIGMRWAGVDPTVVYEYTVCRMDALALGAVAAAIVRMPEVMARVRERARLLIPAALLLGLIGAILTRVYPRDTLASQTVGYSILAVVFALVLLACTLETGKANLAVQRVLSWPVLRSVGKYSYAMYVLHATVEHFIPMDPWYAHGDWGVIAYGLTIIVITYFAGMLSYHLLEKHFLKLKEYFVPKSVPALSGSAAARVAADL